MCRKAGPWARKISATSRAGRCTTSALRGSPSLQGTDHGAQDFGGHRGIERGGLELLVAKQNLDHTDIDLLLQQVRGKAMAQGMHRDALVEARGGGRGVHGAVELSGGGWADTVQHGEKAR